MEEQPLRVIRTEIGSKTPASVRLLLWYTRRRGKSGLLFHCAMRDNFRSMTLKWSIVTIEWNGKTLCEMSGTTFKRPMFVCLPPGKYELTFRVIRARRSRGTVFREQVFLREGDVFLALCEPIQPNTFYRKSPTEDTWRIGILESELRV